MGNFYTDVIAKDLRFDASALVSDLGLLEPDFRTRVLALVEHAGHLGVHLAVLETFRSKRRQKQLFLQHATQLQRVGVHHFGLAADLGVVVAKHVDWHANYAVIGQLAAQHQLIWGGNWGRPSVKPGFPDFGHVQGVTVERQKALFSGQFYPGPGYDPVADLRAWTNRAGRPPGFEKELLA